MRKFYFTSTLALLCLSFLVSAKTSSKIIWNSNLGVYEVKILATENQQVSAGQITIKYPTENTFTYDIQSNFKIISERFYAPKECPTCDFQRFSFRQPIQIAANGWQTLFSFKLTGPVRSGFVELNELPIITINEQIINVSNTLINNNLLEQIGFEYGFIKAPIMSSSFTQHQLDSAFNIGIDYLNEEAIINTNWLGKEGNIIFSFYDENGILTKRETRMMKEGAQRFAFSISTFPLGKYFATIIYNNREMILNDGIMLK